MAHVCAARRTFSKLTSYNHNSYGQSWIVVSNNRGKSFSLSSAIISRYSAVHVSRDGKNTFSTAAPVEGDIISKRSDVEEDVPRKIVSTSDRRLGMPFEEFVKTKRKLRARQRIAGLPFAFLGLGTSSVLTAYMFPDMFDATPDNVQLIMGMDPLIFCGICGVVSCGIGYAAGSSLFGVLSRILNKDVAIKVEEREKDFLNRIQHHRFSDFSKFEDDYYGERIKTLSDYRQWVRTQQKKKEAAAKFIKDKQEQPS